MALTPQIRHTQGFGEVLVETDPPLRVTQAVAEVLMNNVAPIAVAILVTQILLEVLVPVLVLAGELDHRTLSTAAGPLNATWTVTTTGNWTAGVVALKKKT